MAQLKDKIQNALDEARMLMLGSQIIIGFEYRSAFEPGFEHLPEHAQYLKMLSLGIMLVGVMFLMWPTAYHRIVEDGEDSPALHRFTSNVLCCALLPFALGLGLDMFVAVEKLQGHTPGILAGLCMLALALFFWYGLEVLRRAKRHAEIERGKAMAEAKQGEQDDTTQTRDKIQHVLTEARTVLPGAQALLGFQFISMFAEAFEKLPDSSKTLHLISLALVGLSIILLMTPAAYHRIVEEGEETEHFHRFASRVLLASMIPLALGITGDFYVVLRKVTNHVQLSAALAALLLVAFYSLWFGYTLYRRQRHTPHGAQTMPAAAK
jgi:DMSO reductase anchor subunit